MPPAVSQALERALGDTTNAFTAVHEEPAGLEPPGGPLFGLPVAAKDLIDHAGHATTAGSAFYRHHATTTATALGRLEAAGAVVIGRTNLHEFAFGFSSENPWFGPVRNPWDPSLSAGGSSGGSAAAVAAGIVPVALGTDTGGSVRVPAAVCGIIGLKTTHGLIPLDGVFPLVPSFDTVGPLTASLDDLEKVTEVMAADAWRRLADDPPIRRLIVPEAWLEGAPTAGEVRDAFEEFLAGAAEAGLAVERHELADLQPSPHQTALIGAEVERIHGEWRRQGRPYGADVAARIDEGIHLAEDADAQAEARRWRRRITAALAAATAGDAAVVTPAVGAMSKRIGDDRIGGHHYRRVLSWFSAPVNPTGHPALAMPAAGPGRRPAVQLIGAAWSEKRLVGLARRLETAGVLGVSGLPYG
jgi:aspartyl-tRNA(Asn)/glutamyl-tRNA(Gln) amidotransferase subunit A